jgi:hypothetical protein
MMLCSQGLGCRWRPAAGMAVVCGGGCGVRVCVGGWAVGCICRVCAGYVYTPYRLQVATCRVYIHTGYGKGMCCTTSWQSFSTPRRCKECFRL